MKKYQQPHPPGPPIGLNLCFFALSTAAYGVIGGCAT